MKEKTMKTLFSSKCIDWSTPKEFYDALNAEFHFNDDPCPLRSETMDGLTREWGSVSFCNPPYQRGEITKWLMKGKEESEKGKTIVFLIPARTDTKYFHEIIMLAKEIRFVRGRLKFGECRNSAPFPSMVVIFGKTKRIRPKFTCFV